MVDITETKPTNVIKLTTLVKGDEDRVLANETVQSNAFESEDEYRGFYLGAKDDLGLIEPPYNFKKLERLVQENNALGPCIEAMVTNCDGTDFEIEKDQAEDETEGEDAKKDEIWDFFLQPWPGQSFIAQRLKMRRDKETTGNAYLEVIRNTMEEIVFVRPIEAKMIRIAKLDVAQPVPQKITRKGVEVTVNVMQRDRRYAQVLEGKTLIWFKEFGATRDLNKYTGKWATAGQKLPASDRATEIIHFKALPDAHTPYGVPRWISQMPSILGSRKSEEFNLEFFENGGVPPVLIMLQGGTLQPETRKAFEQKTNGSAAKLNRVQVIEVEPAGGSLDKPGAARVTVERFGSERQADSMFEKYDDKCEVRVRRAFRLPPIFIGAAADYSFATAFASYTVAEAQVFKPERDEFDEAISIRLLPAMGYAGYRMKSKGLNIKEQATQISALTLAWATGVVSPQEFVDECNALAGSSLKIDEEMIAQKKADEEIAKQQTQEMHEVNVAAAKNPTSAGASGGLPGRGAVAAKGKPNLKLVKSEGIIALASDTMEAMRNRDFSHLRKTLELVEGLSDIEGEQYRSTLATFQFIDPTFDPAGLAELAGCTIAVMAANNVA